MDDAVPDAPCQGDFGDAHVDTVSVAKSMGHCSIILTQSGSPDRSHLLLGRTETELASSLFPQLDPTQPHCLAASECRCSAIKSAGRLARCHVGDALHR
jgi:hypothetical protein